MEARIYTLIPAVMQDLGAVAKEQYADMGRDKTGKAKGYAFRGVDDVMNAINPVLRKHQVFVVPEVLEETREQTTSQYGSVMHYAILKIRYTFFAPDGSSVQAVTIGEGMDSGDKASNKAMAVAFKYALFQVFCIPTEEMGMDDPDRYRPEAEQGKPFDAVAEIKAFCDKNNLSSGTFSARRTALIKAGKADNKKYAELTATECAALCAAVACYQEGTDGHMVQG